LFWLAAAQTVCDSALTMVMVREPAGTGAPGVGVFAGPEADGLAEAGCSARPDGVPTVVCEDAREGATHAALPAAPPPAAPPPPGHNQPGTDERGHDEDRDDHHAGT